MSNAKKSAKSAPIVTNVFVIALLAMIEELNNLPSAPAFDAEPVRASLTAAGLPADTQIEEHPPVQQSLFEYALNLVGLKAGAGIKIEDLPIQVREVLRGVAPITLYGDGEALARMEWVPVEDTIGVDAETTEY